MNPFDRVYSLRLATDTRVGVDFDRNIPYNIYIYIIKFFTFVFCTTYKRSKIISCYFIHRRYYTYFETCARRVIECHGLQGVKIAKGRGDV